MHYCPTHDVSAGQIVRTLSSNHSSEHACLCLYTVLTTEPLIKKAAYQGRTGRLLHVHLKFSTLISIITTIIIIIFTTIMYNTMYTRI